MPFVNYFNTQQHTGYTFEQIDALYFNSCSIHPNTCTDNPINCGQLKAAAEDYYMGANFSTSNIGVLNNFCTFNHA